MDRAPNPNPPRFMVVRMNPDFYYFLIADVNFRDTTMEGAYMNLQNKTKQSISYGGKWLAVEHDLQVPCDG